MTVLLYRIVINRALTVAYNIYYGDDIIEILPACILFLTLYFFFISGVMVYIQMLATSMSLVNVYIILV